MKPGDVDAVGRGHIWSGDAALARGLVDEFGGLMDAIAEAKRRAGLAEGDRVTLEATPDEPGLLSQLLALFGIGGGARASEKSSNEELLSRILAPALRGLPGSLLVEPNVPQARLEFDVSDD
jgi:protease-4